MRERSAARLAAVQALYQHEMEGTPVPALLKQFHDDRLGATIEGDEYHEADVDLFDKLVMEAEQRSAEIDELISSNLAQGWRFERLDKVMRALLRAGVAELLATNTKMAVIISEFVDVAHAFFDKPDAAFVNGLLETVGKEIERRLAVAAEWERCPVCTLQCTQNECRNGCSIMVPYPK
jgi:N utilization substance protein B